MDRCSNQNVHFAASPSFGSLVEAAIFSSGFELRAIGTRSSGAEKLKAGATQSINLSHG